MRWLVTACGAAAALDVVVRVSTGRTSELGWVVVESLAVRIGDELELHAPRRKEVHPALALGGAAATRRFAQDRGPRLARRYSTAASRSSTYSATW